MTDNIKGMYTEISILLPAYNNVCLPLVEDLQKQASTIPGLQYEILVADDGSTNEEVVRKNRLINRLHGCRYIERQKNTGRAAIRNFLSREAQYGRMLFVDSDLHVCSPLFLQDYVEAEGDVIVGGLRKGGDAKRLTTNLRYRYETDYQHKHDFQHRKKAGDKDFSAACFLATRQVMTTCPFDENFKGYGYEDVLLGKSFSTHGFHISHIDNPLLMDKYEDNETYLQKTEEACRTLFHFRTELQGYSKLILWQEKLQKHPLLYAVLNKAYPWIGPCIRKFLEGKYPSVTLFNAYKLIYYIHLTCGHDAK
ncbi:MAG: glycosyltransferase family 2 protein [Bacteroidaceae bacterium]